jgi:hypothetical protein
MSEVGTAGLASVVVHPVLAAGLPAEFALFPEMASIAVTSPALFAQRALASTGAVVGTEFYKQNASQLR